MDSYILASPGDWLCFGAFEFSAARGELRRDGRLVEIGQRGLDLLVTLLAHAGQAVSKERLMQVAWGGREVEQSNLTVQIATLRRHLGPAFGASAEAKSVIRTVPGYGYVFSAPVTLRDQPGEGSNSRIEAGRNRPAAIDRGSFAEPLTPLIGRDRECRAVVQLLASCRLLTVTGMGGVGKTRLAMRLRHELASVYGDGVTVVDLAPLVGAQQVDEAVASALGAGIGNTTAEAAIVDALRDEHVLLILDNAEHLIASVVRLLGRVFAQCAHVSVLVTSRESLGLAGEIVYWLSPLEVPPDGDAITAAEALGYDSVRLLADRARSLLPDFELDDDAAPEAAEICRRLDGIALAIEMAVPRLTVLSMRHLAERLQDRFGTVAGQRHGVHPRQRTLRTMFDWSWDLLSSEGRRLLQLLAIPSAGITLDALETLAAADGLIEPAARGDVLDLLTQLTRSSLVVVIVSGRGGNEDRRYRLLETTRQYALEQLSPDRRIALSRLHAELVASLFERAEAEWPELCSAAWLDRYGPDADNLRSCMDWAFGRPDDSELGLRLAASSFSLWWELPGLPLREAQGWYALALARIGPRTPPCIEARLRLGQSWTDTLDGDVEKYPAVDQAVRLFGATDDRVGLGIALWRAASTIPCGHPTRSPRGLVQEALDVLAGQPAAKWRALCHVREADFLHADGALLAALAEYERIVATMRSLNYGYGLMVCEGNHSYTLFALGRQDEAIAILRDLLRDLPRGLRHPVLSLLAITLAACGQDEEARSLALERLGHTATIGMIATLARSIEALALLTARSGDSASAARFLGFVLARHPSDRTRFGPRRAVFERLGEILETALPPAQRKQLLAEGAAWTANEAVAVAMRVCRGAAA